MVSRHHQGRYASFDGTDCAVSPHRDRLIIESTLWFVDQKQRRTSNEGTSQRQAALLPMRERRGRTAKEP